MVVKRVMLLAKTNTIFPDKHGGDILGAGSLDLLYHITSEKISVNRSCCNCINPCMYVVQRYLLSAYATCLVVRCY